MKMKKTVLIISVLLTFFSCTSDDVTETGDILIRIENKSSSDFKNILVNTSGGENNYGDLNSNQFSDYKKFELAYRYAFVELSIDG